MRILITTLFLFLLVLIPARSLSQNSLVYSERSAVGPLNPYSLAELRSNSDRVYSLLYEGLFRYDHRYSEYTPILASGSPEQIGAGVYRVELRNDVRWHDGEKFTARDVEFTYRYILQQGANRTIRSFFNEGISQVRASGEFTVDFYLRTGIVDFYPYLNTWIIPSHLFDPGTMSPASQQLSIANRPIGTGKYQFKNRSIQTGSMEFEYNRSHYEANPDIQDITMERSRDMDTRITRLLNRSVDLLTDVPSNRLAMIENGNNHSLEPYQTYSITAIGFNLNHSVLRNILVRQAMTHGTNRQLLLDQWYAGRGEVIHGPFARASIYHRADLPQMNYNRSSAEQLLQQAGYRRTGGYYTASNGIRLKFKLLMQIVDDPSDLAQQNVAENFRDMMQNIGIEIEIVSQVYDDYIASLNSKEFDLVLVNYITDHTSDISTLFMSNAGRNYLSYSNGEVDVHFERFRRSNNPSQRQLEMSRIQTIVAQEVPYLFLFNLHRHAAIDRRFLNTVIDPQYFFTDIDEWRVDH